MKKKLFILFILIIFIMTITIKTNIKADGNIEIEKYIEKYINIKKNIAIGDDHTLVIRNDNTLWAKGDNYNGQLGTGDNKYRGKFVKVLEDVVFVAAQDFGSFAIKKDGTLWATGYNFNGKLGTGDTKDINIWTKVLDDVIYVEVTHYDGNFAIKKDGTLWTTKHFNKEYANKWTKVMDNVKFVKDDYIIKQDGTLLDFIDDKWTKVLDDVVYVTRDWARTLAIKKDGTLWQYVHNKYDIEANNIHKWIKVLDNVKYVSTSGLHSLAIKNDGTLWAKGDNECGALGVGEKIDYSVNWIKVMDNVEYVATASSEDRTYSIAMKKDGTLWQAGFDKMMEIDDSGIFGIDTKDIGKIVIGGIGDEPEKYFCIFNWVKVLDNVIYVPDFAYAIKKDATLWRVVNGKWEKIFDGVKIGE